MAKILIVDDEPRIRDLIREHLQYAGFTCEEAGDGTAALSVLSQGGIDLVILDIMMPKMDGMEVLRRLRQQGKSIPVLMLTARGEVEDKVLGLDSGANDYLTKPFATEELLARIRALARRQGEVRTELLTYADLALNLSTRCLRCGEREVRLGFKEFEVLRLLIAYPKMVVPKEEIILKVWGADSNAEDNNVEVYVSFLRKKLLFLESGVTIRTVRKVGYFLEVEEP